MNEMQITPKDIAAARRVYWWLFLAPIAAVPVWLCSFGFTSLSSDSSSNALGGALLSATISMVCYLPVFIWAFSANPFLKAHARQGSVLLVLRFISAFLFGYSQASAVIWLLVNAVLWLFGSLIGLSQAKRGTTWLGGLQAEILPDAPPPALVQKPQSPAAHQSHAQAVAFCLEVFHSGDASERRIAAARLESLGEVETF